MMIKIMKKERLLFYIIGAFSTFDALKLNLGVFKISFPALLLFIYCVVNVFMNKKVYLRDKQVLIFYYVAIIISTLLCVNTVPSLSLFVSSLTYAIQVMIIYLLFIITNSKHKLIYISNNFFSGLKLSLFVQAIWGVLEIIAWRFFSFKFNDFIFVNVLKLNERLNINHSFTNFIWSDGSQVFRITGIGWEPASFALYMILGYILFDNYILKLLFTGLLFLSNSRTGLVAFFVVNVFYFFRLSISRKYYKNLLNTRNIVISIIIVLIITLIVKINLFNINDTIQLTISRIRIQNINTDNSYSTHYSYYPASINILFNYSNIKSILFGYGSRISGYAFNMYTNISTQPINIPWNPETDVVSILIGNGILGFIAFYTMLFYCIKRSSTKTALVIFGFFISGFLYIYNMAFWYNLCVILSVFYYDGKKAILVKSNKDVNT